jgi:hypothetical protein
MTSPSPRVTLKGFTHDLQLAIQYLVITHYEQNFVTFYIALSPNPHREGKLYKVKVMALPKEELKSFKAEITDR